MFNKQILNFYLPLIILFVVVLYLVSTPGQASLEKAKTAYSFIDSIGVNVHLADKESPYSEYDKVIKPRLIELGIKHIRDGAYQQEIYFNRLEDLASIGIKTTMIYGGNPIHHIGSNLKRLKGVIEAVEGPNETDISPGFAYNGQTFPEGTRKYQKALYEAVKKEFPSIPVIMTSLGGWSTNPRELGYLEWCDICNTHSYAGNYFTNPPAQDIDGFHIYKARYICGNSKPIISTETGYSNDDSISEFDYKISELAAGKYITRTLLEYFNRDIKRAFIYQLIDDGRKNYNFGLLDYSNLPKKSYFAVKNLITILQDYKADFLPTHLNYSLQGDLTNIHHTLLQKSNGNFYLILWQEIKSWSSIKNEDIINDSKLVFLNINDSIKNMFVYDPLESKDAIYNHENSKQLINNLSFEVPDNPIVIEVILDK